MTNLTRLSHLKYNALGNTRKLLNRGGKAIFFNVLHCKETQHSTTFRISFSIVVGNETSRGNSELGDLGVSRSVDGTPRQFRHAAGQCRDSRPRFQTREKNSACVLALCRRKLNCVAIIAHSACPPPSLDSGGVKVTKDSIFVQQLC